MKRLLSIILFFAAFNCHAQNIIEAQKGEDITQYILDSVKYVSQEFVPGIVTFNDGTVSRGAINITTLDQQVAFITPSGEVNVLADNDKVSRVSLKNRTFFRNGNVFVELTEFSGESGIGVAYITTIREAERQGAYGMTSETTAISTYNSVAANGQMYTFNQNLSTPVVFKKVPYVFRNNTFSYSSKKNFMKAFPDKKTQIEAYLKENKVDFQKYSQVKALFDAIK